MKNTAPLHSGETTTPYTSCLVFANGVPTVVDLLLDAEVTMAQSLKGERKAFEALDELSGAAADDLMQQAFILVGPHAYETFGRRISKQHLLRGENRVCPIHKLALVAALEASVKHEFVETWVPWMFEIAEGELDQAIDEGSMYEAHVAASRNRRTEGSKGNI